MTSTTTFQDICLEVLGVEGVLVPHPSPAGWVALLPGSDSSGCLESGTDGTGSAEAYFAASAGSGSERGRGKGRDGFAELVHAVQDPAHVRPHGGVGDGTPRAVAR